MEKRSIVQIEMTGRELAAGRVFETTDEKTAQDAGIFRQGAEYKPLTVVVGTGDLIKGVEDALAGMKAGESRELDLEPANAFGERRRELVAVVPLREFKAKQIRPLPGLIVDINGRYGRVQTVSGGRVRVDFNSELAGKRVHYSIRIVREFKTPKERAGALVGKYFGMLGEKMPKWNLEGSVLELSIPEGMPREFAVLKNAFTRVASANLAEVKTVRFVEETATGRGKANEAKAGEAKGEKPGKGHKGSGNAEEAGRGAAADGRQGPTKESSWGSAAAGSEGSGSAEKP